MRQFLLVQNNPNSDPEARPECWTFKGAYAIRLSISHVSATARGNRTQKVVPRLGPGTRRRHSSVVTAEDQAAAADRARVHLSASDRSVLPYPQHYRLRVQRPAPEHPPVPARSVEHRPEPPRGGEHQPGSARPRELGHRLEPAPHQPFRRSGRPPPLAEHTPPRPPGRRRLLAHRLHPRPLGCTRSRPLSAGQLLSPG